MFDHATARTVQHAQFRNHVRSSLCQAAMRHQAKFTKRVFHKKDGTDINSSTRYDFVEGAPQDFLDVQGLAESCSNGVQDI